MPRFLAKFINLENECLEEKVIIAESRIQAQEEAEELGWVESLMELFLER